MALYKIKDFDPDYQSHFDNHDFRGLDLYTGNDRIGSVDDVLVDDEGQLRYLVINTGVWILGKKVLFPIGKARIDYERDRVYADNLTKAQVEALPEFTNDLTVDYHHEEQVRGVYRNAPQSTVQPVVAGYSAESELPMVDYDSTRNSAVVSPSVSQNAGYEGYDRDSYKYDKEPDLYALTDQNHPNLKLYEERLVAGKTRQKAGEAVISKRVETETARASVAIEKERIVVERVPVSSTAAVVPSEASFQTGEVSRLEVYEEVPEFHKEAFVREEVRVSKVVDQETATTEEQLRREELDVKDAEGRSVA